MAFRGQFEHSLDAKNRLSVPSRFRASFASGVVLAKALDPCVAVWTPAGFERYTESFLPDLNPLSEKRRSLEQFFGSNSFDTELDSAGRITLNSLLLGHADIAKDTVVLGVFDHLEVWNRDTWRAREDALSGDIAGIAESVGSRTDH